MAAMTRQELLELVLFQAKSNGFEFRKWYRKNLELPWIDHQNAVRCLLQGKRYYALLFSHDFVCCFWKAGAQINFMVPGSTYSFRNKMGKMITVHRKAFTRRTLKADSWRFHVKEMAGFEEPLRYIRKFVVRKEDLANGKLNGHGSDDLADSDDLAQWA